MTVSGKIGEIARDEERARGTGHSPVILAGKIKADQGVLPVGLILSWDATDELVPYDVGLTLAGVLDEEVDTTQNGSGLYIPHGSVRLSTLKVDAAGAEPDEAMLKTLRDAGIYAS